jgi:putative peptidoglycan lipid II flippase
MTRAEGSRFRGLRSTSLGTLASRVLGMIRDIVTASLLGMSSSGVMDAFAVAFRVPNLARRLFGEGALSASLLPVFTAELERDRRAAWQLASAVMVWLSVVLAGLVLLGELACGLAAWFGSDVPGVTLLAGLIAAMLPYLLPVCLAAQVSAMLTALGQFKVPAFAPSLLNVVWIAAALLVSPYFPGDPHAQAYVMAFAIVVSGGVQLGVQWPVLRQLGFRFDYDWAASREAFWRVGRSMGPMTLGLAITQLSSLADSLVAWGLAAPAGGPETIAWLGNARYPMQQGAAAAIYYGERLYQLPVGLVGAAVATVIYPLLSRHAARGELDRLGEDLTRGLRLVLAVAVPASVGLVMLAGPIATLLFERGEFTDQDAQRTARMIGCYSLSVWAYCALPVLVRGFYAVGDAWTPVRTGLWLIALDVTLNLTLIWPLAERGLALSTALSAAVQTLWLMVLFRGHGVAIAWRELGGSVSRTLLAAGVMGLVVLAASQGVVAWLPGSRLAALAVPTVLGGVTHVTMAWLLGQREWRMLLGGDDRKR